MKKTNTCKYCNQVIYWGASSTGNAVSYDTSVLSTRHRCEHYVGLTQQEVKSVTKLGKTKQMPNYTNWVWFLLKLPRLTSTKK